MADEKWLDDLKGDIIVIKETLKNMVATNDLKLIAMDEKLKGANDKIKDLEDNNKWLWRTVAGSIIGAAITFLLRK